MDSVAVRKHLYRGIVVALAVATSGCIIPVSSDYTTGEIESSQLQSLVGNTKGQVQSKLGEPTHAFVQSRLNESYYVYSGFTSSRLDVGLFDVMDAHHIGSFDMGSDRLCYLLVFDTDQRMVRYDVQRGDDMYCPNYFWSSEDIERMLEKLRKFEILELTLQAEAGDTKAAYALYEDLSDEHQTFAEAWKWLCVAANGGNGEAQERIGHWHRVAIWQSGIERLVWLSDEISIRPDDRIAHMWYTLAELNGYVLASRKVGFVEGNLTPVEITQAERMVRDWKPGDCPSMENRLGPPGGT